MEAVFTTRTFLPLSEARLNSCPSIVWVLKLWKFFCAKPDAASVNRLNMSAFFWFEVHMHYVFTCFIIATKQMEDKTLNEYVFSITFEMALVKE